MEIGAQYRVDVLVIGGGGAGAMAAVKAKASGATVLAVNKGPYPPATPPWPREAMQSRWASDSRTIPKCTSTTS
jgi:flavin-dependent dehydrogenase